MTRPRTVNQAPDSVEGRASAAKVRGIEKLKSRDARWYLPDFASERATRISAVASHLWNENRPRRENYARYWGLYSNLPLPGLTPRKYNQRLANLSKNKLSLNGIQAVIDARTALVTDQRPRVSFQTSGGDWELQQRAETLEKFNDGLSYENDSHETGALLEKDVGIFGTGILKAFAEGTGENETLHEERVMPFWVFCDDEEAQDGDPRCLYQRKYIDRMRAMSLWPEHAEAIAEVGRQAEDYEDSSENDSETDTVCITEAWHLPSGRGVWGHGGDDTGDGMHAIICGDVLLFEEEGWDGPYPFEFVYAQKPENGIWGRGSAERLQGLQFELNTELAMVRAAMRVGATLRWLVPVGTTMSAPKISDVIGGQVPFTGATPPTPIVPPAVAPEVYENIDRIWSRMFEVEGISQMTAQSEKPPGLNAAVALQTYANIESRRFQVDQHQYFNFFLRLARLRIHLARKIGESNPQFAVKSISRKTMTVVKWADAHMDERDFAMKEYATSAFAQTPEARKQQIQDILNSGSPLITPQEGRRLLNDPDLEEFDSLQDASYDLTRDIISDILAGRPATPPLPLMDLMEAKKLAQLAWLRAYRTKAPKDRLDALLDWVQQVQDAIDQSQPPAPPQGAAPPGAQGGPPPGIGPQVQGDVQGMMARQAAHQIMGQAA